METESEDGINETLDALEAEQNKNAQDQEPDQITDPGTQQQEEEKPPGFLNYKQWIEKGKDPKDFKGENAYSAEYDRINELREIKGAMKKVVSTTEAWQQQQRAEADQRVEYAKTEAKADLERAIKDEEVGDALKAQDKLHALDKAPSAQAQPLQDNPVVTDFIRNNPMLDRTSPQFDPEFYQDVVMINDSKLDQLTGGDRTKRLSDSQLERVQRLAFNQAKELHADKFVSRRNRRVTTPAPNKQASPSNGSVSTRLKAISSNPRNPRDVNSTLDVYEMLKEQDPKVAETYAKNILGDD